MNTSSTSTYQVSARKYRPHLFEAVVGQEHIVSTLKNAIKQQTIAHAYLFSGIRGVGKTTCARIFAQAINCERSAKNEGEPCGECASCQSYQGQNQFNIIELDAASNNSVDNIRDWVSEARVAPVEGKYKVYILDEAHMLSTQAFNAFLKTLEEPPPHAIFILATTEKHKLLPTILSRCQLMDFVVITLPKMQEALTTICKQENIEYEDEALFIIAEKADGSLRDALSIFDKVVAFSNKKLTVPTIQKLLNILDDHFFLEQITYFLKQDTPSVLNSLDVIYCAGNDTYDILEGLSKCFRNMLVVKEEKTKHLLHAYPSLRPQYEELATKLPFDFIISAMSIIHNAVNTIRFADNKRYFLEYIFIQLSQLIVAQQMINEPSNAEETSQTKPLMHSIAMPRRVVRKSPQLIEKTNTNLYIETEHKTISHKSNRPEKKEQNTQVTATSSSQSILQKIREQSLQKIKSQQVELKLSKEEIAQIKAQFIEILKVSKTSKMARPIVQLAIFLLEPKTNVLQIQLATEMDKFFFDQELSTLLHIFISKTYGYELNIQTDFKVGNNTQQTFVSNTDKILEELSTTHPYFFEFVKKFKAEIIN